jgi:hypothetical protein
VNGAVSIIRAVDHVHGHESNQKLAVGVLNLIIRRVFVERFFQFITRKACGYFKTHVVEAVIRIHIRLIDSPFCPAILVLKLMPWTQNHTGCEFCISRVIKYDIRINYNIVVGFVIKLIHASEDSSIFVPPCVNFQVITQETVRTRKQKFVALFVLIQSAF